MTDGLVDHRGRGSGASTFDFATSLALLFFLYPLTPAASLSPATAIQPESRIQRGDQVQCLGRRRTGQDPSPLEALCVVSSALGVSDVSPPAPHLTLSPATQTSRTRRASSSSSTPTIASVSPRPGKSCKECLTRTSCAMPSFSCSRTSRICPMR